MIATGNHGDFDALRAAPPIGRGKRSVDILINYSFLLNISISIVRSVICGIGFIFTAEVSKNMMQVFSLYNVVALVTIVGGYFLMYYLIDKKLNLA